PGVKRLFEDVLRAETGADIAYYHEESVAGRLRAGTIRTGDIYSLESWRDRVVTLEIRGEEMADPLREAFAAQGDSVEAASTYRVASTDYVADDLADAVLGRVSSSAPGRSLRNAAIDWIRTHGLARGPAGAGDRSA
ncbi:MAG: 5'-nucleotidase C-terminal domain-containing protein, partial [Myxococcota bacterium]